MVTNYGEGGLQNQRGGGGGGQVKFYPYDKRGGLAMLKGGGGGQKVLRQFKHGNLKF